MPKRTDLAAEAHEFWRESSGIHEVPGARLEERELDGFPVTVVDVLDQRGADALGKPPGRYVTLSLVGLIRREAESFPRACRAICTLLQPMLPSSDGCILVVCLGNADITPDAIGPLTARSVCITRHMVERYGGAFGPMRPVACVVPGVLGTTGMESLELVRGAVAHVEPACVIVIDALASRRMERVCTTVQLTDTGIVPGSGVGNSRAEVSQETLGVPVIAIGVPTVVDAATLAMDLLEAAGITGVDEAQLSGQAGGMIVTPREIDMRVAELARVIGYGITLAVQPGWGLSDVEMFLG